MSIKIIPETDYDSFVGLVTNAYTEFDYHLPNNKTNLKERLLMIHREDPTIEFYGYYKDDILNGCMRFHDYVMNLRGTEIKVGGVGLVAVDLLHKKEKIAKEMMHYFLNYYKSIGATIAMLYPFRPDFYKKMGFGFGTKMNLYKIKPENFPKGNSKKNIRYLTNSDQKLLLNCYNDYVKMNNGLLHKTDSELSAIFKNPANRIIGCEIDGILQGYCIFTFSKGGSASFVVNDLQVKELVYNSSEALSQFFTFFHSQFDQIRYIEINTQDEDFHLLFSDPRNGTDNLIPFVYHETNTSGVGIMYRVLDVKQVFQSLQKHRFPNLDLTIRWNIEDNLIESNNESLITSFQSGILTLNDNDSHDVEVNLQISDFSSFITGAVSISSLARYGLVQTSDVTKLQELDRLFYTQKPLCMSGF
jgi:predicted acetyltransferase